MQSCQAPVRSQMAGFTLLELLVVLIILAALVGLVLPRVDWARRSADESTAASGMTQVMANLQLFRTATANYPTRMDSLLEAPTGGGEPTALYGKLWSHSSTHAHLEVGSLTPTQFSNLVHLGVDEAMDHNPAPNVFPGESGTIVRALTSTSAYAVVRASSSIIPRIFPLGLPAGVRLVAFGIGLNCSAVGKTMQSAPFFGGIVDPELYYNRYIAIFAVSDVSGKRAELVGVVDPLCNNVNTRLKNFSLSLPDAE